MSAISIYASEKNIVKVRLGLMTDHCATNSYQHSGGSASFFAVFIAFMILYSVSRAQERSLTLWRVRILGLPHATLAFHQHSGERGQELRLAWYVSSIRNRKVQIESSVGLGPKENIDMVQTKVSKSRGCEPRNRVSAPETTFPSARSFPGGSPVAAET